MNIETASSRTHDARMPGPNGLIAAFAQSLIDETCALPVHESPRARALEHLDARIKDFMQQNKSASFAQTLVSMLRAGPEYNAPPGDAAALSRRRAACNIVLPMVIRRRVHTTSTQRQNAIHVRPAVAAKPTHLRRVARDATPNEHGPTVAAGPRVSGDAPFAPIAAQGVQPLAQATSSVRRRPVDYRVPPCAPAPRASAAQDTAALASVTQSLGHTDSNVPVSAAQAPPMPVRPLPLLPPPKAPLCAAPRLAPCVQPTITTQTPILRHPSPEPRVAENTDAPPAYTSIDHTWDSDDDGAPGPSRRRHLDGSSSDRFFAQQQLVQEDADYAYALQLQLNEQAESSETSLPIDAMLTDVYLIDGAPVPSALICSATQTLFVDPVFDTQLQRTIERPSNLRGVLPKRYIEDRGVRAVVEAWQMYHIEETMLADALREAMTCSITQEVLVQPVIAADGYTYERSAICHWLATSHRSPMSREPMTVEQLWPASVITATMREYGMLNDEDVRLAAIEEARRLAESVSAPAAPRRDDAARFAQEERRVQQILEQTGRDIGQPYQETYNLYLGVMIKCNASSLADRLVGSIALPSATERLAFLIDATRDAKVKAHLHLLLSDLWCLKKDYHKCLEAIRSAAELTEPLEAAAFVRRAAYLRAICGQMETADVLANVIADEPENALYQHAALGEVARRRGLYRLALTHFDQADEAASSPRLRLRQVAKWRKLAQKKNSKPA